jgi:hypothetical protein
MSMITSLPTPAFSADLHRNTSSSLILDAKLDFNSLAEIIGKHLARIKDNVMGHL